MNADELGKLHSRIASAYAEKCNDVLRLLAFEQAVHTLGHIAVRNEGRRCWEIHDNVLEAVEQREIRDLLRANLEYL